MKILLIIAFNLVTLACVGAAAFLAFQGIGGWGWFLFAGLLVAAVPKSSGSK